MQIGEVIRTYRKKLNLTQEEMANRLWGFPKGATPPFGTRLCEAKCCVIRSVGVAVKMPLPPGRARAFEAAGKQGCACVA